MITVQIVKDDDEVLKQYEVDLMFSGNRVPHPARRGELTKTFIKGAFATLPYLKERDV